VPVVSEEMAAESIAAAAVPPPQRPPPPAEAGGHWRRRQWMPCGRHGCRIGGGPTTLLEVTDVTAAVPVATSSAPTPRGDPPMAAAGVHCRRAQTVPCGGRGCRRAAPQAQPPQRSTRAVAASVRRCCRRVNGLPRLWAAHSGRRRRRRARTGVRSWQRTPSSPSLRTRTACSGGRGSQRALPCCRRACDAARSSRAEARVTGVATLARIKGVADVDGAWWAALWGRGSAEQ